MLLLISGCFKAIVIGFLNRRGRVDKTTLDSRIHKFTDSLTCPRTQIVLKVKRKSVMLNTRINHFRIS